MKRVKIHLSVILAALLIISSVLPATAYGTNPPRNAHQPDNYGIAGSKQMLSVDGGLVTDSSKTGDELAQMLVGDGVPISNVVFIGNDLAKGTFSGGANIIGFDEGIILSSGGVANVVGPNESDGISGSFGTAGDSDLSSLIGGEDTNDASVLEFDFIPEANVISFTYVFASDEYNEYVYSYNDVFGFFLNGENVALIPGTNTPVSIDNVNGGNPYGTDEKNPQYYRNNDLQDGGGLINTEMDGLTTVLHVEAQVIPNEINHIKLAVADALDTALDSVVFIKAGSFDDKPINYGKLSFELENCIVNENVESGYAEITVLRNDGSDGVITVDYATSDLTTVEGMDYELASGTLTFNDGETQKSFTVPVIDDYEIEGDEEVQLTLSNPTGGAELGELYSATLTIKDDEQPPQFYFTQENYTVAESVYGSVYGNTATITVRFTGYYVPMMLSEEPYDTVISVVYSTSDGTATADSDYIPTSGIMYFEPWGNEQSFDIVVLKDNIYEGNETVNLTLSEPEGGTLGEPYEAILTIIDDQSPPVDDDDDGGSSGGGSSKKAETPPPTEKLPDGSLIDRMKGYIVLSEPTKITSVKEEIKLSYDEKLLDKNLDHSPRIYYWNAEKENWVALASYDTGKGKVTAVNDGEYKGWFTVFGVIQPEFRDLDDYWAEEMINRMNGLGMIEGYKVVEDDSIRVALPENNVTWAEFTMFIARILNIDIDDHLLPDISDKKARSILEPRYDDYDKIPDWVFKTAAVVEDAGILPENRDNFESSKPIDRINAAVMISRALNIIEEQELAELEEFEDYEDVPEWAREEIAEGVIEGYPDKTFKPNENLTRAEALQMLYRLFVSGLGW